MTVSRALAYAALLLSAWSCVAPRPAINASRSFTPVDTTISVAQSDAAAEVEATIAPYREQLGAEMNRVVAQVARPLTKRSPEGSLGNFVADLTYAAAVDAFPKREVAFAIQNSGGLRVSTIDQGPLLVSQLYELMPFDNELVLVQLAGTQVRELVEHIVGKGGWPVSEQLRVEQTGEGLTILLNGQPLDDTAATYYVATNDYVAGGGDDTDVLARAPQEKSGRLVRDVLIEYAGRATAPIDVTSPQGRIVLLSTGG